MSLDEIKSRLEAATPGPWFQGRERDRYENIREVYNEREPSTTSHDICTAVWSDKDAEFIAHAPTDVAQLVADVQNILNLHAPCTEGSDEPYCRHCYAPPYGHAPYPCPTVQCITAALEGNR